MHSIKVNTFKVRDVKEVQDVFSSQSKNYLIKASVEATRKKHFWSKEETEEAIVCRYEGDITWYSEEGRELPAKYQEEVVRAEIAECFRTGKAFRYYVEGEDYDGYCDR